MTPTSFARRIMGPNENCVRLLKRCFSAAEWDWLLEEEQFKNSVARLESVEQIEGLINIGLRLIAAARTGAHPSGRLPPKPREDSGPS